MQGKTITWHTQPGYALTRQKMNADYEFPFTLNPMIGCLYACRYCYLQQVPFKWQAAFGEEVKVKTWLPEAVNLELASYRNLPQHLKRVQVGNACECYLPQVVAKARRDLGRDLMAEIYGVFKSHWDDGNRWMVHVVTKSDLIGEHTEILSGMRDQVQVELTLVCLDERRRREFEPKAPTVEARLRVIKQLAEAGVFVRVMAMPLLCGRKEALELWQVASDHGARAIKNKGLNYFSEEDVRQGNAPTRKKKEDRVDQSLLIKSGEPADGRTVWVRMPPPRVNAWTEGSLILRRMPVLRSGYAEMNDIDWRYLV